MIKIAVIGHGPEDYTHVTEIARRMDDALAIIKRQHFPEQDVLFNVNCEPGVGQWFCSILAEYHMPYEVYISNMIDKHGLEWSDAQRDCLRQQIDRARAIHICAMANTYDARLIRNKRMVDDAQWILVFWNGSHRGITYETMLYALTNNKIVYNGIDGLHLLDNTNIKAEALYERI